VALSLASRQVGTADSEFREIIGWYEDLLERTFPPTDLAWEPVKIGPTWQYESGWVLPTLTLGWRVLAWCGVWLRDKHGSPWQFTPEQARFILWFFAVDEDGGFLYHSAVLQRLKGWGKDPLAACVAVAAMFADVTFDHWDGDVPVGREEPSAWVQLVAVSQEQTQNTMKLFPSLISPEARRHYGVQVGKMNVYGLGDTRQIQAVTASPLAIEGGRPTLIVRNETQNWNASNGGHDMAGAIEGNAAKSEGGAARMLDICNAYRPGEDSVGQRVREGWDSTQSVEGETPMAADFGLLYDSLEAPPEAPLTKDAAPGVVDSIRGDATWLSTKRILASILNPANTASESRRKWFNQITAVADAWADPNDVKIASCADRLVDGDEIVLFGDGSKSDDATGLVACRVSDGLCQVLHVQQPKAGTIVDRNAVDLAVSDAFRRFKVVAFYFDPSHVKDDDAEGDNRFWWPLCDEWMARFGKRLKMWPVQSGPKRHAVVFDMSALSNLAQFEPAAEHALGDLTSHTLRFAESTWLTTHMINARESPGRYGMSVRKEHRESRHKIDLAVCLIGARMMWRSWQLSQISKRTGVPGQGRVIALS
jgi:hypothetical protein